MADGADARFDVSLQTDELNMHNNVLQLDDGRTIMQLESAVYTDTMKFIPSSQEAPASYLQDLESSEVQYPAIFHDEDRVSSQTSKLDEELPSASQDSLSTNFNDFAANLDKEIVGLPRDIYIPSLCKKANNSDSVICSYRQWLVTFASKLPNCPKGRLYTRKSTDKSSSNFKFARDCYILQCFIDGDNSEIDQVFNSKVKDNNETKHSLRNEITDALAIVELKTQLLSLQRSVSDLSSTKRETATALGNLRFELASVKSECDKLRQSNALMKQAIEFMSTDFNAQVASCEARHNVISETITNSVTSPTVAVGDQSNDVVVLDTDVNTQRSDITKHNKSSNKILVADISVHTEDNSIVEVDAYLPNKHDQNKVNTKNNHAANITRKPNIEFLGDSHLKLNNVNTHPAMTITCDVTGDKITKHNRAVHVTDHIWSQESYHTKSNGDEDMFEGVKRVRTTRFYLSGIRSTTTRQGIINYLKERGVSVKGLRIFDNKHSSISVSAKLTIPTSESSIVDDVQFWPDGVFCRRWLSVNQWQDRNSKDSAYSRD